MAGVKLINVSKSYNNRPVLTAFSTLIKDGDFVMITGPNGSGKSTLLNIIGGIEKPDAGEVILGGKNIRGLKGKERTEFYRKYVGFIFQGFFLDPKLTIRENIALPGVFANMKKEEISERAETISKILGILDSLDKYPSETAGGHVERACIARALFLRPRVILADEPTSNLDKTSAEKVLKILQVFQEKTYTTVIVASHDDSIRPFATKLITLGENYNENF